MKWNILQVLILCACFGQIQLWSNELPEVMKNELKNLKESMMHGIYNISEKFVDDFIHIIEMNRGDLNEYLFDGLISAFYKRKNARIDAEFIQRLQCTYCELDLVKMDSVKILQSVYSKRMAPEQYNGLINLFYVFKYDNATLAQIESALNYVYGIDNAATKTSFLNPLDFPDPSAKDCPDRDQMYTDLIDKLKLTIDLRTKVLEDITAIREKFPCNIMVRNGVNNFMNVIDHLNGDSLKIGACLLKENPGNWAGKWNRSNTMPSKDYMEYLIEGFETVLFTRLSDETTHGIINLLKANIPGTPIDEIEKALEYLYDDVPRTKCT
ncbi:uncharacterized protein LOC119066690 [Bradysia coprophila]|uniref:uncharacterized protein LOC119066690 n=1 Tax=Bradysia coprophila TaxID=38358 RepID=UPI00187D8139|nr:uncharacterized protein LOC119066690 [Bradysia coprophila]